MLWLHLLLGYVLSVLIGERKLISRKVKCKKWVIFVRFLFILCCDCPRCGWRAFFVIVTTVTFLAILLGSFFIIRLLTAVLQWVAVLFQDCLCAFHLHLDCFLVICCHCRALLYFVVFIDVFIDALDFDYVISMQRSIALRPKHVRDYASEQKKRWQLCRYARPRILLYSRMYIYTCLYLLYLHPLSETSYVLMTHLIISKADIRTIFDGEEKYIFFIRSKTVYYFIICDLSRWSIAFMLLTIYLSFLNICYLCLCILFSPPLFKEIISVYFKSTKHKVGWPNSAGVIIVEA